jgi:hypothetical protein
MANIVLHLLHGGTELAVRHLRMEQILIRGYQTHGMIGWWPGGRAGWLADTSLDRDLTWNGDAHIDISPGVRRRCQWPRVHIYSET